MIDHLKNASKKLNDQRPYAYNSPQAVLEDILLYLRGVDKVGPVGLPPQKHFVSASCEGHFCVCRNAATHKLGEEIPHDDPNPDRHNLTSYVCCSCFTYIVGKASGCLSSRPRVTAKPEALQERLTAVIAERDAALDALVWCSGSADFAEGGKAREGWLKLCAPLISGERFTRRNLKTSHLHEYIDGKRPTKDAIAAVEEFFEKVGVARTGNGGALMNWRGVNILFGPNGEVSGEVVDGSVDEHG